MSVQFKIRITKDILSRSKDCGVNGDINSIGNNCAIAIALMDIFPDVQVKEDHILPFGHGLKNENNLKIPLPLIAQQFIKLFDGFRLTPRLRMMLPEFEFNIDISEEVIEVINIDEVKRWIDKTDQVVFRQAVCV